MPEDHHFMKIIVPVFLFCNFIALSACSTFDPAVSSERSSGLSNAFTGYVFERGDKNQDNQLSLDEWRAAGGNALNFKSVDDNGSNFISRDEMLDATATDKFFNLVKSRMLVSPKDDMTPSDFDTPVGVSLLSSTF